MYAQRIDHSGWEMPVLPSLEINPCICTLIHLYSFNKVAWFIADITVTFSSKLSILAVAIYTIFRVLSLPPSLCLSVKTSPGVTRSN